MARAGSHVRREGFVEQLKRHTNLIFIEDASGANDFLELSPMAGL
jgi:hypothetical protein